MHGECSLNGLEFNQSKAFHKQIKTQPTFDGQPLVADRNRHLGLHPETPGSQFMRKTGFINTFE